MHRVRRIILGGFRGEHTPRQVECQREPQDTFDPDLMLYSLMWHDKKTNAGRSSPRSALYQMNQSTDPMDSSAVAEELFSVNLTEQDIRRFWSYVEKTDGCWWWKNKPSSSGYGTFGVRKRYIMAHRLSYFMAKGAFPDLLCICHTCDNPLCVRPDHLWVGTDAANIADRDQKGRTCKGNIHHWHTNPAQFFGERNPAAKLTPEQMLQLRHDREILGMSYPKLGAKYGISFAQAYRIVQRTSWKHII